MAPSPGDLEPDNCLNVASTDSGLDLESCKLVCRKSRTHGDLFVSVVIAGSAVYIIEGMAVLSKFICPKAPRDAFFALFPEYPSLSSMTTSTSCTTTPFLEHLVIVNDDTFIVMGPDKKVEVTVSSLGFYCFWYYYSKHYC